MNSGRLPLIFVITLFLTFLLASGNVTAEMLFQSPQSPPEQPPAEQPPVEQPPAEQPPTEQPSAEQPPAEQPPAEQPPIEQPPAEQPPVEQPPVEQPPAVQPPAEQPPAEQPSTEQPTGQTPLPAERLLPVEAEEEAFIEDEQAPSNLVLDRAELIDTIIVSGASVWRCCGIILLLLVPLSLLLFYIRGRSKIAQEENF
jgi:cytoskeletal protein RodZ